MENNIPWVLSCVTGGTTQATHCEDKSEDVAFPPFSREDLVSALSIVETVPSQKPDQAGFVDPKLPPHFSPSKGVGTRRIREWNTFPREGCSPS
jgi:hypothetical protein